jgi:predicted NAD/FAD-binding protein
VRRRIAIVGSGISGLTVARGLYRDHDITVFEAGSHIGGHTNTIDVPTTGGKLAVDTGFIVFNYVTYPNFTRLLAELGIEPQLSTMSFSVKCERTGLEYNGANRNALFAQRRNIVRPGFWRMIRDILRFNREAPTLLSDGGGGPTLGEFLSQRAFSREFIDYFIVPMGAAIWSTRPEDMLEFPAKSFIQFFSNHGMLTVGERPSWYVVPGGSRQYVERMTRPFRDRIRLDCPVRRVARKHGRVEIATASSVEHFDAVVLACHSDQSLALLADPSIAEKQILSAFPYQKNEAVLHTDSSILPRRRAAWAAWNYHIPTHHTSRVAVTYNMNMLQGLEAPDTYCVTLNHDKNIDPGRVIERITYHHPMFTAAGIDAQRRRPEISGVNRSFFCGAYWRYGFHEDGMVSGLQALQEIEEWLEHEKLYLSRAS